MPSNHLVLCSPLLPLPSIFPSIRVFSNESALHIRWPKYWTFIFSISWIFIPSNEYSGLIFRLIFSPSFRMDGLDLLASTRLSRVFSAPQFESIILWCSAFLCTERLLCVLNTFDLIRIRTLWDRNHDLHFIDGETDLDRSQAGYTTCQLRTAFMFCLSHCNEDSALCAPFTCDTYFTHHFLYF